MGREAGMDNRIVLGAIAQRVIFVDPKALKPESLATIIISNLKNKPLK